MWWRILITVLSLLITLAICIIVWEKRTDRTSPAAGASQSNTITMTHVFAGGAPANELSDDETEIHEEFSSYDINEGKRLYHWFNCHTCHANGGGDIGPALMDEKWLYGSKPKNIFATILEGRPNGMPSFRGKIPDQQVWQIVAYIRSMSGHAPLYARPSRSDDISAKPPETLQNKKATSNAGEPSPDRRSTTK
jgi:cytochrome c oxidase cbb3-type subunit 3